ncbi:TPA: hypothetical protein ACIJOS_001870 [Citrobacter koseri]
MNKNIFNEMVLYNEQTWERLSSMMKSEDDIGVVLRLHLITEKIIEAWCCAASNNPKFFDGFGENLTMSYAAKLKLASNFGLNDFSYQELKEINRIRNARSHQIDNAQITDKEIQKMITHISEGGQKDLIEDEKFGIWVDGQGIHLNKDGIPNREKFIAILAGVIHRITKQANNYDGFIKLL